MSRLDDIKARVDALPTTITGETIAAGLAYDKYERQLVDLVAHAPVDLAYLIGEVERWSARTCDTCRKWRQKRRELNGVCGAGCGVTGASFYCAAWEAHDEG